MRICLCHANMFMLCELMPLCHANMFIPCELMPLCHANMFMPCQYVLQESYKCDVTLSSAAYRYFELTFEQKIKIL